MHSSTSGTRRSLRGYSVSLWSICLIADSTPAIPQCTTQRTSRSQEQQPVRLESAQALERQGQYSFSDKRVLNSASLTVTTGFREFVQECVSGLSDSRTADLEGRERHQPWGWVCSVCTQAFRKYFHPHTSPDSKHRRSVNMSSAPLTT